MESFSLLKYWRGTGASAASTTVPAKMRTATTTIAASALRPLSESGSEDEGNDEGPFFDLEFALPNDDSDIDPESINEHDDSFAATDEEEEGEFKFAVSPAAGSSDPSLTLSPTDDLFFKGRLVSLDPDSKSQHAVPLLKTATKLRVLMLALRKPKATAEAVVAAAATVSSSKAQQRQSKFFIKFKVDEMPIVSLFTRDNSSRGAGREVKPQAAEDPAAAAAEERRFTKEVVQKYLSKIKPLYLKVSKRYIEKLRFAGEPNDKEQIDGESSGGSTQSSNEEAVVLENGGVGKRQIAIVSAGLKVVYKRLGKTRSASSAVAAAPSPPPPPTAQRRDDSLLQQQDGIQSAILHCKRSFNAARESQLPPVGERVV